MDQGPIPGPPRLEGPSPEPHQESFSEHGPQKALSTARGCTPISKFKLKKICLSLSLCSWGPPSLQGIYLFTLQFQSPKTTKIRFKCFLFFQV